MNPEPKLERLDQKVWLVNWVENILNFYISRTNLLKKSVNCCYEYYGPIHIREAPLLWENNLKVDKRGGEGSAFVKWTSKSNVIDWNEALQRLQTKTRFY
jgi:hypothetical protein